MSLNNTSSLPDDDLIQQHPPERGRRNDHHVFLAAFSGCSCCCCCLHTLGGLIGVAVVGNHRAELEAPADATHPPMRLPSSQGLFWNSFLVGGLACMLIGCLFNIQAPLDSLKLTVTLMIIFGPAWLLGACVISAFQISVRIEPQLQSGYWRHLGKIVVGILTGSVIGFLVMWGMSSIF